MELSKVSAELQAPVRRLAALGVSQAWRRGLTQFALALFPKAKVDGVRTDVVREAGAHVRVHMPQSRRGDGALLWIHGGGYVIGRAIQDDRLCAPTAAQLGVPVISVEYRLAPSHPFPAPLDDCHAAWAWLLASADKLGVNPGRIAIGGQSAGGGLAAALVQRVHDGGGPRALAQWLFCPMLDDRTAARRDLDAIDHFVWNNRANAYGWRAFLGVEPGAPALAPYAAPARREDLSGLPPAWIGVGEIDLFLDEDRAYAERLMAAGVDVEFRTAPGAPHGFEAWARDTALARAFVADAQVWLAGKLHP